MKSGERKKRDRELGQAFRELIETRKIAFYTEEWKRGLDSDLEDDDLGVTIRRLDRALHELRRNAPADERERFRNIEEEAIGTGRMYLTDVDEHRDFPPAWLWGESFFLWGTYLERGEQSVLINLPSVVGCWPEFYLRQWWVSHLIGSWHLEGWEDKIRRLLFGERKRGQRSFRLSRAQFLREYVIGFSVTRMRLGGLGYNEAIKATTHKLNAGELGVLSEVLSVSAVKMIYRRSPFSRSFR